jgi:hypothetical protein
MHKDRIAEQLLALLTTRERAASTAGDLIEDARTRGDLWFWSSVLRTTGALLWRTFAVEPTNFLKLAVRGTMLAFGLCGLAQLPVIIAALVLIPPGDPVTWARISSNWGVLWTYNGLVFAAPVLCMFHVGRWVARRAPGRELTGGVVLIVMQLALTVLLSLTVNVLDARGVKPPSGNWYVPANLVPLAMAANLVGLAAILAGAIWVRRRLAS